MMHFHLFLVQLFLSMFCYNNTLNRLVHLTTILHWLTRLKDGTSGHHCSTSHFILCLCHATQAGRGIVFSTSPFVHLLPNFWTRYFKNYKPILIAQVVSGQGHEMITFGGLGVGTWNDHVWWSRGRDMKWSRLGIRRQRHQFGLPCVEQLF